MDTDEELARLEAAVYSRAGGAESAVDFIDPVSGETVRATPSELRLRALRAERAAQAARLGAHARLSRLRDAEPATAAESLHMPAHPLTPGGGPSKRAPLPLVAAGAFAAGILLALLVTSVQANTTGPPSASENAAVLRFDSPSEYPELAVPDLGDQFVADSIRNVSGTSPAEDGFGIYLGREAGSDFYCLIVQADTGLMSDCETADDVARQGLRVLSTVTVLAPASAAGPFGETVVTAVLTPRGQFSMSFPPPGEEPAAEPLPTSLEPPPTTPGETVLGTWTSENGDFQASLDAHGQGVSISLDCLGDGTVTVDLSDGGSTQFDCTSVSVERGGLGMDMPYDAFGVTVFTTGSVVWGLTIASTPVTEEIEG